MKSLPVAQSATLADVKLYSETLFNETFVEALVYGDFKESDARKSLRLYTEKTGSNGIQRDSAFDLEFLDQPTPEDIQYVGKLAVNNS